MIRTVLVAATIASASFVSTQARAGCPGYYDTSSPVDRWVCYAQTRSGPVTGRVQGPRNYQGRRNYYAAIAVSSATASSPTVYWGKDELADSEAQAKQLAVSRCHARGGPACKVTVWGPVDYLALALGAGNHWGAGADSTPQAANAMALSNCRTSGGGATCAIERQASIAPRE